MEITSESIINQLRNASSLVDGSLIADSLKSILVGLCDLVTQQQKEITNLQGSISKLISIEEFNKSINELSKQVQDTKTFFTCEFSQITSNFTTLKDKVVIPMQNIVVQNQNDFQNKISELENSLTNQASLLFGQCSTTAKNQKVQIDQILSKLENLNNEYSTTKTAVEDLKIIDSHAIDERFSKIDNIVKAAEIKLTDLSNKEENFEKYVNDQIYIEYNKNFSKIYKDIDELKLCQGPRNISNQSLKINDMESLILAVERNSRRLDGVDQIISGVKLDYSDIKDIVSTYRTVLLSFKESLYEISTENDESQRTITQKLSKMSEFVDFVSKHFDQSYDFLLILSKYLLSLSESSSKGFDQIKSIFHSLTKATIPEFNFLYQSIDDQFSLKNQLAQTITEDDIEGRMKAFSDAFKSKNKQNKSYNDHTQKNQSKFEKVQSSSNIVNILENDPIHPTTEKSDQTTIDPEKNVIKTSNTSEDKNWKKSSNLDDKERFLSLAKRISNCDIPPLATNDIQVSLKNINCIKDLFFRAEPMRLHLADLQSKFESLTASFDKVQIKINETSSASRANMDAKADVDDVARAFEKTNKVIQKMREEINIIKRSIESFRTENKILNGFNTEDNSEIAQIRSNMALSVAGVAANAAANARGEGAAALLRNQNQIQVRARTQLASLSPPARSRAARNQPPLLRVKPAKSAALQNPAINGKKKKIAPKSAEISPREKLKMMELQKQQDGEETEIDNLPH